MFYISGWLPVLVGTISVCMGSLVVFYAEDRMANKARYPSIIFGTILIAIGTTLVTWGWNNFDSCSQKKSILIGVYREWEVNDYTIKNDPLFSLKDVNLYKEKTLYQRFQSSAPNHLLYSGFFSLMNKKEENLLKSATEYEAGILDINRRLASCDNFVLTLQPEDIIAFRKKFIASKGYKGFILQHQRMGVAIKDNVKWMDNKEFMILYPSNDSIKDMGSQP
jgi:hypothetical protein